MGEIKKILGIDTSNYKTSVAIVSTDGEVLADVRELLKVEQGERGLRQSNALFQHIENLPGLLDMAVSLGMNEDEACCTARTEECSDKVENVSAARGISAVAVSSRPRPVEGSYMPCFNAGLSLAKSIGSVLGVPVYEFSHQEGHIEAVLNGSEFENEDEFIAYHLSGGTCEMLKVTRNHEAADKGTLTAKQCGFGTTCDLAGDCDISSFNGYKIEIIGGSKDISYGQVLDRAGVAMGLQFPAGEALDYIATNASGKSNVLKGISVDGLQINLSGIDSQFRRVYESVKSASGDGFWVNSTVSEASEDEADVSINPEIQALVRELFHRIASSLVKLTENAYKETGINKFVFVGGVSSSEFVRAYLSEIFDNISEHDGKTDSSDRAVCGNNDTTVRDKSRNKSNNKTGEIKIMFGSAALSQDNAVGTALLGVKKYGNQTR